MSKRLWLILSLMLLFPLLNLLVGIRPFTVDTKDDPGRYGLNYETVSFRTEDGLTLHGWFIPAASSPDHLPYQNDASTEIGCGTIIVGHGYPFDKANILRHVLFLRSRFNLFLFDFRYFGESEGAYTTVGIDEAKDIRAAVAYLKQREDVDPNRLGAMGFSMSAAAFILARSPALKAIVADSPYGSLEQVVARQFFFLPGFTKWPFVTLTKFYAELLVGVDIEQAAPAEVVRELKAPLLLIHGDRDSQIPISHAYRIAANANPAITEFWIVSNADHGQAHTSEGIKYELRVLKFFSRHLSRTEENSSYDLHSKYIPNKSSETRHAQRSMT